MNNPPALSPADRSKLAAILGMLGSDHAGERSAAALAADKLVRGKGLTWRDLLLATSAETPPPRRPATPPRRPPTPMFKAEIDECLRNSAKLTTWETGFISDLLHRPHATQRQLEVLEQILRKVRATG